MVAGDEASLRGIPTGGAVEGRASGQLAKRRSSKARRLVGTLGPSPSGALRHMLGISVAQLCCAGGHGKDAPVAGRTLGGATSKVIIGMDLKAKS